ncbi:MAG: HAD-IA family hydrolase, partial [Eubacteriales bacterium]|nr:HAD-IA family hydrolase [Eubacteriales bacterium]
MNKQNVDSLLFDLDGTLWDACISVAKGWQKIIQKIPEDLPEITEKKIRAGCGYPVEVVHPKLLPNLSIKRRKEVEKECMQSAFDTILSDGAFIYEGVEDTLKLLYKNYKLFLISNCSTPYMKMHIEKYHFDKYYTEYICNGDNGLSKEENIKYIIKKYSLKRPIYVGDTIMDYEASKKANVEFVWAMYGFGKDLNCINRIKDIRELP